MRELIEKSQNRLYYLLSGVIALLSAIIYLGVSDRLPRSGMKFLWIVLCCFLYSLVYFSYSFFWYSVYDFLKTGVKNVPPIREGKRKASKGQRKPRGRPKKTQ